MSKNAELAKHDLYEKAKGTYMIYTHFLLLDICMHCFRIVVPSENYDLDSSGNLRPSPLATREGSLLRSLPGKDLHEVLAESDRALRVVKDMFEDDPMVRLIAALLRLAVCVFPGRYVSNSILFGIL